MQVLAKNRPHFSRQRGVESWGQGYAGPDFLTPLITNFSSALLLLVYSTIHWQKRRSFADLKNRRISVFWILINVHQSKCCYYLQIIPGLIISAVPWWHHKIHTEKRRRKTSLVIDELGPPHTLFVLLVSDDPESRSKLPASAHYCLLGRTR